MIIENIDKKLKVLGCPGRCFFMTKTSDWEVLLFGGNRLKSLDVGQWVMIVTLQNFNWIFFSWTYKATMK